MTTEVLGYVNAALRGALAAAAIAVLAAYPAILLFGDPMAFELMLFIAVIFAVPFGAVLGIELRVVNQLAGTQAARTVRGIAFGVLLTQYLCNMITMYILTRVLAGR